MFWVGCVTQLLLLHPGHINPAWFRVLHRHFMLLMSSLCMSSPDSPLPGLEEAPRRQRAASLLLPALNVSLCPLPPPFSSSYPIPCLLPWERYPGVGSILGWPQITHIHQQPLTVRDGREGSYGDDGLPSGFLHPTCLQWERTTPPDRHRGIRNTNPRAGG